MLMKSLVFNFFKFFLLLLSLQACKKTFGDDCYTAYFGGEVINPNASFVLFMKDDKVIDTLFLDKKNRFFKKFDSLTPGMYTFKHEPEYQYVYFDKNDSLMVRINTFDFDESIVFCGRGDAKNNFLMDLYLKNQEDRKNMFSVFDFSISKFQHHIDSTYIYTKKLYEKKKEDIKWSSGFDLYAKACLDFHHFSKKEIYPVAHKMRTGRAILDSLPKDFYQFRKDITFDKKELTHFSPFVKYLTHYLNNISSNYNATDIASPEELLKINIRKLEIADSIFKNKSIKNTILDNIAFAYFLEDQNIANNKIFLEKYQSISTDKTHQNEILCLGNAIQKLTKGNNLPEVTLIDRNGKQISSNSIFNKKSVVFFWTESMNSHLKLVHKKALDYLGKHNKYNFIAINIDDDTSTWLNSLEKYSFGKIQEFKAANFEELKDKWVITKLHRTLIIDENGKIENGFVNLFDVHFEEYLK